jgi:predicted DNA-binding transcriptional regulator YafY
MRADRLLSALLLLQAHGKQTGRELAARLAVSERTIHRDMEALSAAGVPVFALRGMRGGWQLDDQWRTEVPGLDEAELRAFLMAQPRVVGDALLAAAAERALDKLLAALPVTLRQRAAAMRQRLFVDTTGWYGPREDLAALPIVQDALSRDRQLRLTYAKPADTRAQDRQPASGEKQKSADVDRVVDPLGLVAKGATWYLVANTPAGFRTFRVSRIVSASVLETPSARPVDFDLAAHWTASAAAFIESRRRLSATVRVDPHAADRLRHWFRPTVLGPSSPADRSLLVEVKFDDEEQAAFVILGLGHRAEVLAPASLRQRVDAEIAAMSERHHRLRVRRRNRTKRRDARALE